MGFNRIDAKLRAKASMRNAYPHPMLVTLVYLLSTSVLCSIIRFFIANPFDGMLPYLRSGYSIDEVMAYVNMGSGMTLFFFLTILLSLYSVVMQFGFTSYSLRLARNEQPTYRNLLDGFSMAGRVLLVGILSAVFTFLWGMLAMIPYMVVLMVAVFTGSEILMFPAVVLAIAAVVFELSVTYRYRLAFYYLLDNPGDITAREAITKSKYAMRGFKSKLFVLDLSFLGWILLVPFTLGILSLWLTPYMGAADANFYDAVTGDMAAGQPYPPTGPNTWGNSSGPGPAEPF